MPVSLKNLLLKISTFFQVMNESARIARGPVRPLSQLTAADAEAVVIPGGFGAAKNLSDFGFKGESKNYGRPIKPFFIEISNLRVKADKLGR